MSKRKKKVDAPAFLLPAQRVPCVCGLCKKEIAYSPELDRWVDLEPCAGPAGQTPQVHEHLQTCSGVASPRDWKPPVMETPAQEDEEPEWN